MFGLFKKYKYKPSSFQFTDSPDTVCVSCRHVVTEGHPILSVTHDYDGVWQFICGQAHSEADTKIISLKEITKIDQSLNRLYAMPVGMGAERKTKDSDWTTYRLPDEY